MNVKQLINGGEGGIRTHGTLSGSTVFETARFNHSRTSPFGRIVNSKCWHASYQVRARFALKNCCMRLRHSSARTPLSTSIR